MDSVAVDRPTDRFHSLTVVLERDTRDDDAEAIIAAIKQLRGVADASGCVADIESRMAETRARAELGSKLLAIVYPKPGG